jgi:hypothetical protein
MAGDAAVRAIIDELTQRHGGREALGVSGAAVVIQIASLLASGTLGASDARTIASLQELLPAPVAPKAAPGTWDISGLDDPDFGNILSAACRSLGGERVVDPSTGAIRIPYFNMTPEAVARIERILEDDVRLREECARATAALVAARAALEGRNLAAQDAVRPDPASAGSARGPAKVVALRLRTPQEADDCKPVFKPDGYVVPGEG